MTIGLSIQSLCETMTKALEAYIVSVQNQTTTNVVGDKKRLKKATNLAEKIILESNYVFKTYEEIVTDLIKFIPKEEQDTKQFRELQKSLLNLKELKDFKKLVKRFEAKD